MLTHHATPTFNPTRPPPNFPTLLNFALQKQRTKNRKKGVEQTRLNFSYYHPKFRFDYFFLSLKSPIQILESFLSFLQSSPQIY